MKLTEFLNKKAEDQAERHREISELKFLEMLKENCRNSYTVIRKSPIYMTDKDLSKDFYVCTPEAREIKTAFWLDRVVKEMTSWNRFPKRSKYLRGYTTIERAGDADMVYVMIPFDMTRIGICPSSSFYRSFEAAQRDFDITRMDNDGLATWVVRVCKAINQLDPEAKLKETEPDTVVQFKGRLGDIEKAISGKKDLIKKKLKEADMMKDEMKKVVSDLIGRHITSVDHYFEEKLDPESNGFTSVRVESFARHPNTREVWIDKPCLLVKRSKYIEMHKRGAVK